MRIGIDIRTLEGGLQHRGIGRYATQLIEGLSKIDHVNEYVFITSNDDAVLPKFNLDRLFKHSYYALNKKHVRQLRFIRILFVTRPAENLDDIGLNCILQLDITFPLKPGITPIVSVLYDLIPLIYRETYQRVRLQKFTPMHILAYVRQIAFWYFTNRQNNQYAKSASVISISKHSAKDLVKYYPKVSSQKIYVTHLASTPLPAPNKDATKAFKNMNLQTGSYIFYVGGLDPRKGLIGLVRDFAIVRKEMPNLKLVLGGKEFNSNIPEANELNNTIKDLGLVGNVIQCNKLDDSLMNKLYQDCAAFVFPSRYEGFGLPILEAMDAGCPVVCYDNSSIPEVAGSAAVMVRDGESLVAAIISIASNPAQRKKLILAGARQAKKFNWEKTARQTKGILEGASR